MKNYSICGADIGNITSSFVGDIDNSSEFIAESRLEKCSDTKALGENDILEIDENKFVVNQGDFQNEHLKFKKSNFVPLLYYGLAKTCKCDFVKLAIGIPAGQFNKNHKALKEFIKKNGTKKICIEHNGKRITRTITIMDVLVRPESYGIKFLKSVLERCQKSTTTLIVDIGGGTTDVAIFDENMKFVDGKSLNIGLLDLYKDIRGHIESKYYKCSLEEAKKFFDGELNLLGINDESFKNQYLEEFMNKLLNSFRGEFPSAKACNIVLAGGGQKIANDYFKKHYPQTIEISDISVNAKAFYNIGESKWRN